MRAISPLLLFALAVLPAQAQPRPGALTGRVVDAAGQPMAQARVRALPAPPRFGESYPPRPETSTDAEGAFRLPDLRPGWKYTLIFDQGPFAPARRTVEMPAAGREPLPPLRVTVTPGADASGRVVDSAGRPVEGARVRLYLPSWEGEVEDFEARLPLETVSGADGRFVFPHLAARRCDLHVAREDLAPRLVSDLEIPGKAGLFDLGDIRLEPGAAIEGRVLDEDGRPIEGAEVGFYFSSELEAIDDHPPAYAGPDGSFILRALPAGDRYRLWIRAEGFVSQDAPDVVPPTPEPLRIQLRRAHTLTIRVVDTEGNPVPKARLSRLEESSSISGMGISGSIGMDDLGWTNEQGLYSVAGLEAGAMDLLVEADAFETRLIRGARIPDTAASSVEIELTRGAAVEGQVLDRDGKPVTGVFVTSHRDESEAFTGTKSAMTDAGGHYRLEGLAPGSYQMSVERFADKLEVKTEVGPGLQHLDLRFQEATPVSGQVLDSQGAPVARALLTLVPVEDGEGPKTASQTDGTFTFDSVPDGRFRLRGSAPGFAETTDARAVDVSGEPVQGLVLRLVRGVSITGRLIGADPGQLRPDGIEAHLWEPGRREHLTAAVDRSGSYRIDSVSPGVWEVSADLRDGRSASAEVEVGTEPVSVDLEFEEGLTLSGRVLLDGRPLAAADVSVDGATSKTAYDGGFSMPGLQPGTHRLQVLVSPGIGHTRSVELRRDEDKEITVSLSTGGLEGRVLSPEGLPIAGAVVEVSAEQPDLDASFEGLSVRTGEDGLFALSRVLDGSYRLRVQAAGFPSAEIHVLVPPGDTIHTEVALKRKP
ncbi:MAG TPA: carboxypeptidase-like regulatory domain-containing protein [Thermoanaerobaculia bacterium]|nr:carboxypeptidase-like regulatory domain-containing protein [Thermoanaerobaculia bacterium]